ncbi:hypothetical protein QMK38_10320 [Lysinibacillus fusiformis]|nr:hypothetical protein [Lysinibacillus fusiformis]
MKSLIVTDIEQRLPTKNQKGMESKALPEHKAAVNIKNPYLMM